MLAHARSSLPPTNYQELRLLTHEVEAGSATGQPGAATDWAVAKGALVADVR